MNIGEIMIDANSFDDSKINWEPLPGPDGSPAEHIGMSILNIDETAKIVDVLFKFAANEKIVMHKHTSAFNTFVVKGEHHIYNPSGDLTEIRPAGTYKAGLPSDEPHTEGGGDEDVVILFSLRPYAPAVPIYEILDENSEVAATMTFDALKELHASRAT